ncbi:MAG TPA: carboxypeptidase-like regulatory domain-containing protein, partial [Gemmatimonadaceae bacterium]
MAGASFRRAFLLAAAALLSFASAAAAQVQTVTFSGRVTSQAGGPLSGAMVSIVDFRAGGAANAEGNYTFTVDRARVAGRTIALSARYLGHKPQRFLVAINTNTSRVEHNFVLERDVLNLE